MALSENNYAYNMHILLAKYLSKETDANETAIVELWIEASAANKTYFEQLQKIWTASKKLDYDKKLDVQKALADFRERTIAAPKNSVFKMRWLQAAAIIILIIGVATIIKLNDHHQINSSAVLKFSAGNMVQIFTLPDSSIVQLQPHAELTCPAQFAINQRNVELKGDAYFSVLHDASRPFQIAVNDIKVRVLGTSFRISDSSGNTEVDVITGVVQVSKEERSMKVFPHEKVIVPASNGLWIKQSDTISQSHIYLLNQNHSSHKSAKKELQTNTAVQQADTVVDDYTHQRQAMISIINDLINERLVADRGSIVWAALTDSLLIVNGKTESETVHQKLKTKYHIVVEEGYYYGPVQITGKGYFLTVKI